MKTVFNIFKKKFRFLYTGNRYWFKKSCFFLLFSIHFKFLHNFETKLVLSEMKF
jgi:hypothetical protein